MLPNPIGKMLFVCSAAVILCTNAAIAQNRSTPGVPEPNTIPGTGPPVADMRGMDPQSINDRAFVRKVLESSALQTQLAQLAQEKSSSDDVKKLGKKIVEDQTWVSDQIKVLAKLMGVEDYKGPNKKDKQFLAKFDSLGPDQFDSEFLKATAKDNHQDVKDFNFEAQTTQKQTIKQVVERCSDLLSKQSPLIQQTAQAHTVSVVAK